MQEASHILVVDGSEDARHRIRESLGSSGVECTEVGSAAEALGAVDRRSPDLVVLDLILPDLSGLGLARMIRERVDLETVPILVVSEHASEMDRILAFEMGVDDFVAKPFYARELAVRVRALLRSTRHPRRPTEDPAPGPRWAHIDATGNRIEIAGQRVDLTKAEFEILNALIQRAGRVVRRRELIEQLHGPEANQSDRAVDAHVKTIRRKLGKAREALQTVRGVGYRFDEPSPEA